MRRYEKSEAEYCLERLAYYINAIKEETATDFSEDIGAVRRLETDLLRATYWANRYLIAKWFTRNRREDGEEQREPKKYGGSYHGGRRGDWRR